MKNSRNVTPDKLSRTATNFDVEFLPDFFFSNFNEIHKKSQQTVIDNNFEQENLQKKHQISNQNKNITD